MTKLFLDTEFTKFGGELISMALVPEDDSPPFYEELVIQTTDIDPWVKENVYPHLFREPVDKQVFQVKLQEYLARYSDYTIVADWPDDIKYFCQSLITGPGMRIMMNNRVKFEMNFGIQYVSKVPHNALHDAIGIKEAYLNLGRSAL